VAAGGCKADGRGEARMSAKVEHVTLYWLKREAADRQCRWFTDKFSCQCALEESLGGIMGKVQALVLRTDDGRLFYPGPEVNQAKGEPEDVRRYAMAKLSDVEKEVLGLGGESGEATHG
jgi:hypothetical protein